MPSFKDADPTELLMQTMAAFAIRNLYEKKSAVAKAGKKATAAASA